MEIYYLLFIFITVLGILPIDRKIKTSIIIAVLTIFAGTRVDIDSDYPLYKDVFDFMPNTFAEYKELYTFESCLYFVTAFSRFFFYSKESIINFSFLTFAFLGVTTKMISISKYANYYVLSILIYLTNLFFIQEMTTIRAGVAAGIFLLAIPDMIEKKYWLFFLKIALCFIFHSSSVFFIIVFVLVKFIPNIKYYYIGLGVAFILLVLNLDIVTLLRLDLIFPKVAVYLEIMSWLDEGKVNLFNFRIIFSLFFFLYFAYHYKKYIKDDLYFDTLFKIHVISLIFFFALSLSAVTFSLRSFELLSVIQILLYPLMIKTLDPKFKIWGYAAIIIICIFQLYYTVEISDIFKPYKTWL